MNHWFRSSIDTFRFSWGIKAEEKNACKDKGPYISVLVDLLDPFVEISQMDPPTRKKQKLQLD